ncbi:uncharacterized protein LOC135342984 isoform X6 [Halichondria panicea]|uniref:uncharacterized protein LOC135342984 isoform X6 n=1 Tax=Halichondria panicea TaxID=6063 RepID=UPI00312B4715
MKSCPNCAASMGHYGNAQEGFVQTINCTALPMEQYLSKLFSDHKEKKTCFRIELRKYRNSNKRCSTDTTWITGLDKTPQILEVDFLLLIIAGDIETNPGPVLTTLTLSTLHEELVELTNPLLFGKHLGIPQLVLDKLHPNDVSEQKNTLLQYIANNYELYGFDWEKIADALDIILLRDLATKLRSKYCQHDHSSSSDEYLSAEEPPSSDEHHSAEEPPPVQLSDLPRVGLQERFLVPDPVPSQQPTEGSLVPTRTSLSVALGPPGPSPSIPPLVNEKGIIMLMKRHNVTDKQLNTELREADFSHLAKYFDRIELYVYEMDLTPSEQGDVTLKGNHNIQDAMIMCLSYWRRHNPSKATYKSLLNILVSLDQGLIADNVCQYLAQKNEDQPTKPKVTPETTVAQLNQQCSNDALLQLSAKIADYNGFKVRLGLSDAEINAIDLTISDIPGRFYAALKKWKSKGMFDSTATYGRLVEIARILEDGEAFQSIKRACIEHTIPKQESQSLTTAERPNLCQSSDFNMKRTYVCFACGCDRCCLLDRVLGKKCPNQKQYPFPKIGLSQELSDDVMCDLNEFKESLLNQSRRIHGMFLELMTHTFETLKKKKVDIEKVKYYLRSLFPLDWRFLAILSQEEVNLSGDFNSVQDFYKLSYFLQERYCTWYNYDLIARLRKKFLYRWRKDSKLENYESSFKDIVYRRCFLYLDNGGKTPKYQTEVVCKIDIDYKELSQPLIEHLTSVFANAIGLGKYHLVFKKVIEGCTELVFRAPQYIMKLKKLSPYQVRSLREHNIIAVRISDRYLFRHDHGLLSACEKNLELLDKVKVDVSPCTLWTGLHNGQPCTVLKYEAKETKSSYTEYTHYILENKHEHVVKADCIHLDDELSHNPIIVLRQVHLQTINGYLSSTRSVLSEIEQLSFLLDIAKGFASLQKDTSAYFRGTENSVFIHVEESIGNLIAQFFPVYKQSYFPRAQEYAAAVSSADLIWLRRTTILLDRESNDEKSELPESHVLYNIFKHKWLSDDERLRPRDVSQVAKEVEYIRDLEKTRLEMIDVVSNSEFQEVSHLNMILIGHTGVGKTSIRKHLQNLLFAKNETSTILFEHELLFVQTVELLPDTNIPVFQRNDAVYSSEKDKVFLTLWDTGGQPMFQDLLPCFAKFRSIYGVVFRISDFSNDSNAVTRPTCPLESESESPYTCKEYIKRCLAFLEFFAFDMNQRFIQLPNEVKNALFQNAADDISLFPKVALIGTFKDKMMQDNAVRGKYNDFKKNLLQTNFVERSLCPSYDDTVFEVDNTKSGDSCEDPGIKDLREKIITETQLTKTKIPLKWIAYKLDLENESRLQRPCTGIVTLSKANEIAKKQQISSSAALSYFHELGIFLWYRETESLNSYVIVESRHLLSILGTLLNPKTFISFPGEWKNLQEHGILNNDVGFTLLDETMSRTGVDREWIFSFFREHHLIMNLSAEGYFIPSLLQVLPICSNPFHICDAICSMCTLLPQAKDMEVAPLFLVPKCKCIPPGFFPRLMTMLAGIQDGEIIWKISVSTMSCKNVVSFIVGGNAFLVFTEFIDCIRIYCTSVPSASISQLLCRGILRQIRAQIERLFLESSSLPIIITFACPCSKSLHFLPSVPANSHDKVICTEHPGYVFEPCESHLKWLQKKITSDRDAEEQLKIALEEGGVDVLVSTVLFVGSNFSDQIVMDDRESGSTSISRFFILEDNNLKLLQSEVVEAFLASNAAELKQKFPSDQDSSCDPPKTEASANYISESKDYLPKAETSANDLSESKNFLPKAETSAKDLSELKDFLPHKQHSPLKSYAVNEPQQIAGDDEHHITKREEHSSPASTSMHIPTDQLTHNKSRIVTLMQGASDELQSLHLMNAIECKHSLILTILPLLTPQLSSFGILDVQFTAEMLEKFPDISEKWIVIAPSLMKTSKNEIDLVENSPHRHKFALNFSGGVLFSSHEEVLKVLRTLRSMNKEQIPYSWFYLWSFVKNTLQLNNSKIITLDTVIRISDTCGIESGQQLQDALAYLHKCGLLIYFKDILPNVIFEDVSLLMSLMISLLKNIKYTGLLTDTDFHAVQNVYDSIFTYDNVIKLLKGLCLLSQISSHQFLMPCVLTTSLSPQDLSIYCKEPCLVVQHPMATNVFGFLICFVTSQESSDFWPWKILTNPNTGDPVCIFSNCAQFSLPGYDCMITLFASNSCVRIYTEYKNYQPPLFLIKTAVIRGIEKACKCYQLESLACDVGFNCICGSTDIEHNMIWLEQSLICSFNSEQTFKLSQSQQRWFDEGISSDDDSITVNRIFRKFLARSKVWYEVGMELGLDTPTLSRISLRYQNNPDLALMEAVRQWFKKTDNPQLLDASLGLEQESKRLFDEAMKHGHVLVNIVNMLVFGPAGTGKTNLKCLLTDKPPPLQRDSTPCMEKPVRIRPVSNTKFKSTGWGWEEMSQPKLLKLLAQIISKLPKESTDQSTASRVAESLKRMTTITESGLTSDNVKSIDESILSYYNPSDTKSDEITTITTFSDMNLSAKEEPPYSGRMLDKAIDDLIASVVSGVAEQLKLATQGTDQLLSRDQQEGELFDSNWVYVTDSGGQPQFHDISPLFIKHISVALVVLRLTDELSSFPSDEYYKDGQLVGSPHASHMTLGETLQSIVRSIESHTSQDRKPKMIFVGTFLDQLRSLDTLIKRNQEILDMLPPDSKKLLVYNDPGLNNLIFGLNTISRDDDSLATANRIRITVERSIPLQVKMPIWWSFLDSLLQSLSATLERGVLSIEECLRLATRFGYVLQDLQAALVFFDNVCIAHYYPSILPNTVFVDAQIPLDKITELSQHAISLRNAEVKSRSTLNTAMIEVEWKRFRDEGIITLGFLRFFKKHYVEGIFSPEDMLLIMKDLLVVAPIALVEATPHQAEFFMPSLLTSIQPVELDKIRSSFTIAPLAVYFRSGCIRSGVFCCLVVDVIKRLGWKVLLPSGETSIFAKNCIQYEISDLPCTVTLIDSFSYMEVYIDVPVSLRNEVCPMIRNEILHSIKLSCAVLHYVNDTPKTAIFCPCKKSTGKLHLADVIERSGCKFWKCSLQTRVWGELSDEHRIWLDNSEGSGESSSVTGDMCTKMTLSDQQQQSGKPSSATGDTLMKTERKSDQQQYSVMEDVCKKTGVRDQQLNQEIPESDIILIAQKFPHLLNVHKALTINDLQHVYKKLHESASPHWFNLGFAFGLTHPVLTNIDRKHRGNNVSCLREMLARLLSTQHVTWSLLSDALKKPTVDLINLADSITANQSTTPNLLDRLNLTSADLGDVTDVTRRYGNQAGVAHALIVWQRVNPSRATFRALVEIALGLRRGDIATDICRFIVENGG